MDKATKEQAELESWNLQYCNGQCLEYRPEREPLFSSFILGNMKSQTVFIQFGTAMGKPKRFSRCFILERENKNGIPKAQERNRKQLMFAYKLRREWKFENIQNTIKEYEETLCYVVKLYI